VSPGGSGGEKDVFAGQSWVSDDRVGPQQSVSERFGNAIPYPLKRDASTNTSDARHNLVVRSGGNGADDHDPVASP
jgi:hypothetical protein